MIKPEGIPRYTGNPEQLEKDASGIRAMAGKIRTAGAAIDTNFQGLSAFYHAPEAEQLFATTRPIRDKSNKFAGDLEKIQSALSDYWEEIHPLVLRLNNLREEAKRFVESVKGDDNWQEDSKNTDKDKALRIAVDATVAAFAAAEIRAANRIVALSCGIPFEVGDGSKDPHKYGYKASDLDRVKDLPWGHPEQQKHSLLDGEYWFRSFVQGFVIDGTWGSIKGLLTLVGFQGTDQMQEAWKGLAKLGVGLTIGGVPDEKLPPWMRERKQQGQEAVREAGKSLVALDQWKENPARAAGAVSFNGLTLLTGAGNAGKAGAIAKSISVAGKAGTYVDPMAYVLKGAGLGKVKAAELMAKMRSRYGTQFAEAFNDASRGRHLQFQPNGELEFTRPDGKSATMDRNGVIRDEHGNPLSTPAREPSGHDLATHETLPAKDRVLVHAGAAGDTGPTGGHHSSHTGHDATNHSPGRESERHPDRNSTGGGHATADHGTGRGTHADDGHTAGRDHGAVDGNGQHQGSDTHGADHTPGRSGGASEAGAPPASQRGVWPARNDIPGPAAGEELKRPHPRHTPGGAAHNKQVAAKNSIILRDYSSAIDDDIAAIADGRAKLVDSGNRYEINGRTYGVELGGRIYPDSGPGIVNLDRNEYAALQQIARAKGDISGAPQLTKNPRFVNNPQAVQKALEIYNGTYL
ncbi:hypothetical protein AB8O64_20590 [Streptomyces sp. QH1-20]|uniref:hypothetical protein n=1 Tax=Streptomyces sp. QH1-20 TaxID=3240934 RepID=UPI0035189C35